MSAGAPGVRTSKVLEGWVDYLARVGWVRGRLRGRGGDVCKRQILQISVFVGEERQYAKRTKSINNLKRKTGLRL